MSSIFRLSRALRHSGVSEFMSFTSRLSPPKGHSGPLGWWDGGHVEKPKEKVSPYDFGYPLSPTLTEKGKESGREGHREESQ